MAEFPDLGKRCHTVNCQQLDFLPFECAYCHKIYCLDHRSVDGHNCTEASNAQKIIDPTSLGSSDAVQGPICDLDGCEKSIASVKIVCDHCKRVFCLEHRHPFDHKCTCEGSSRAEIAQSKAAQYVEEIKKSMKTTSNEVGHQKPVSAKNATTAAKIALMKLKQTALGDGGKIPEEERLYLRLQLPPGFTCKNSNHVPIMFSKTWSVGKCIDTASSASGLPNENNKHGKKKLRLMLTNGRICEMDERMSKLEEDGELVNGGNSNLIYE